MKEMGKTHAKSLPKWGPYTKKYIGISHIPDVKRGLRFDLSVFPGFYRRKVDVPNVNWESGYHPWEASADLGYYVHRHELEWKDRVYTDVAFCALDDDARLIRCECVNNTDASQNIVLHYMAYMNFPPLRIFSEERIRAGRVELPAGVVWVDAMEYAALAYAAPRPTDNLVPDGLMRAEVRRHGFVGGRAVGDGFGRDTGDTVAYRFTLAEAFADAVVLVRYKLPAGATARFAAEGCLHGDIELAGTGGLALASFPAGVLNKGAHTLHLTAAGGCPVELDGFCVAEAHDAQAVRFTEDEWHPYPELLPGPAANSVVLKYADVDEYYGLVWLFDRYEVREFYCDELDRFMRHTVHNHVSKELRGSGGGHFANVFLRPIELTPESKRVVYGMVCSGSREKVAERIAAFIQDAENAEALYLAQKRRAFAFPSTQEGEKYRFSQQMMAANTLIGVVYPVYVRGTYIRHNSPGRWWDCLYTWDSGFLGIGLSGLDVGRAVECLNAYLTAPGDTHAAFIHHGSPVPVQIYLFLELWNLTQSKELLAYFYPRVRQYHAFLSGRLGSSTTGRLKSGMIVTWDYFYNSGGWDDYPPQAYVHGKGITKYVAPVANTAHCIRTAKILRMAAEALGETEDVRAYDEDIRRFTAALQTHARDEATGLFGYVRHDENGVPAGILRHESGENFDKGLDGAYPLVAGICTGPQERGLLDKLMNEENLWTPIGLSTVDRSAPYYRPDGYWNGAVWFPHQWFFWKTMLDLGQAEVARRIAHTGLEVWRAEVEESYHCFEHFMIQTGRGAGWHQFTGISTPVMSWFGAYYTPGRITAGFDVWVDEKRFTGDNDGLRAALKLYGEADKAASLVVTMNPAHRYRALWNGGEIPCEALPGGALELTLPGRGSGTLEVVRAGA